MQTIQDQQTGDMPVIHEERVTVGGRELIFEVGRVAELAGGAVTLRYGDTLILSAATASKQPREGIDFFPLTVDYEERMSAAGKIPGGFLKREGRPGEHAVLSARLTDRPIRPLFPKGYRNDVHIVTTVFSTDQQNDPDILSITGASTALMLSSIPFQGPVAGVRLGYVDGQIVINPTYEELETSDMNVVVAGTRDAIMMVEGEALEVSEEIFVDAIELGHRIIKMLVDAQLRLAEAVGAETEEVNIPGRDPGVDRAVQAFLGDRLTTAMQLDEKTERNPGHQLPQDGDGRVLRRRIRLQPERRNSRAPDVQPAGNDPGDLQSRIRDRGGPQGGFRFLRGSRQRDDAASDSRRRLSGRWTAARGNQANLEPGRLPSSHPRVGHLHSGADPGRQHGNAGVDP